MHSRARPWALTVLWVALMVPLSLAGLSLQGASRVPYEVFPLVMAGPAVAALICRVAVPGWYPADAPREPAARSRSLVVVTAASAVFLGCFLLLARQGAAMLPEGWPVGLALLAMVVGLAAGGWLEEIGYRGTMYRALSARLAPSSAVLVNGIFFGLCHLQYFGAGWLPVALFVVSAVLMDIVMVSAWSGPWRERVLIAAGFHGVVNVTLALWGTPMTTLSDYAALALSTAAAAVMALVLSRWVRVGDFAGATAL